MNKEERKDIWRVRLSELRKKIFRREVAVFSFFLILAFIFWFLNALSKDIDGKINYPVRYINFPEGWTLVNELPDQLEISVQGPGYSVVQTKLGGRRGSKIIDLELVSRKVQEDSDKLKFYVLTYNLRDLLSSQIRSDFKVASINPDTIFFELDRISSKKVKVIADIEVNPQRQFMLHGKVSCKPDSVKITGPQIIVDTIIAVYTRHQSFNQINSTETKTLTLVSLPKIGFSERRIEVSVPVAQFTEAVLELPVTMINVSDTSRVRLFPEKVSLQCIVALSDYNSFIDTPIEAVVDLEGLDISTTNRLKITLKNVPDYAYQLRFNPQLVEYLIEKR